ncbi:MAG: hypothetical protein C0404_03020, partial [Verrucomicrobia bacterium]|nr:hypothetical protein [Verrucomicrobiota bacterium]
MSLIRKTVLVSAIGLVAVWIAGNHDRLLADSDATIRLVLGLVYTTLIILRWKPADGGKEAGTAAALLIGLSGALLAVCGIVVPVKQFEWIGLIFLVYAAMRWALPVRFSRDILLALFVLYWMHPMPSRLFGAFQMEMQALSVAGAEWLLHCFNVRVWADLNDLVLRTGLTNFAVDEACSGMRTSLTVFLCALGTGILMRFRWFETLGLVLLGILQTVALNIIRISFMVAWAPRMGEGWATTFLHDTLGILLLFGIFAVSVEAAWWKVRTSRKRKTDQAIESGEAEPPDRATILPRFWHLLDKIKWIALASIVVVALIAGAAYKRRPAHRARMIAGVIEGLIEKDAKGTERAVRDALRLTPGDRSLATPKIQSLVLQGRHDEALAELAALGGALNTMETVMKSWSLMAKGRPEEASSTIEALPDADRNLPGVAIIRAEYAAIRNMPDIVASNVLVAGTSRLTIQRVRNLFPYLASHEQWSTIADSDNPAIPYQEFPHCLIAIRAYIETGRLQVAGRITRSAMKAWPGDVKLLGGLYSLALSRPGSEWEGVFASTLLANLSTLDADRCATYIGYCFQLNRPELAWLSFMRLQRIDPDDPALPLAAARYGDSWFVFRKHNLGMVAGDSSELVDLRELFRCAGGLYPCGYVYRKIPLAAEMVEPGAASRSEMHVARCLNELEKRRKSGKMTMRLELTLPVALTLAGRYSEAHDRLDEMEKKYPQKRDEILLQRASLYVQQREWQRAYEVLLKYRSASEMPNLQADALMVNVFMNLNLGICALETAESLK